MSTIINIMSFEDAAIYSCLKDIPPTIVISIDDKGFPITPIDISNPCIYGVLKLWFADSEDERIGMTEEDAKKVVSFVKSFQWASPEIVVHCAAGVSRSAGVGAALMRWLNGDDTPVMESPYRRPNFLCYTRVLDATGIEYNREEEIKRFAHQRELAEGTFEEDDYDFAPLHETFITDEEIAQMKKGWSEMFARIGGNGSPSHTMLASYISSLSTDNISNT